MNVIHIWVWLAGGAVVATIEGPGTGVKSAWQLSDSDWLARVPLTWVGSEWSSY